MTGSRGRRVREGPGGDLQRKRVECAWRSEERGYLKAACESYC